MVFPDKAGVATFQGHHLTSQGWLEICVYFVFFFLNIYLLKISTSPTPLTKGS